MLLYRYRQKIKLEQAKRQPCGRVLKKGGYILVDAKGYISLTSEGLKKAESIYERHRTLTSLFVQIAGVPEHVAEEDACRCEHVLSAQTFQGIKMFLNENGIC